MKKVAIYAYLNKNLGDDLFIEILCSRYPDVEFHLITPKKNIFQNRIDNLKLLNVQKNFFVRVINKIPFINVDRFLEPLPEKLEIQKFDASVYIGGSIFMETTKNWEKAVEILKKRIYFSNEFYILGCNFGPYFSGRFLKEHTDLFSKVTDICFRDQESYKLFEKLKSARCSTDIVFGMEYKKKNKQKSCLISVIDLEKRNNLSQFEKEYLSIIKKQIFELIRKGYKVNLVSFCNPEGDMRMIQKIMNSIEISDEQKMMISVFEYQNNMKEILSLFEESELVIASRFHAMILGFVYNSKVLPMIYSKKMLNVLEDIDFNGEYIDIQSLDSKKIDAEKILQKLMTSDVIDISEQRQLAHTQFEKLDELLRK